MAGILFWWRHLLTQIATYVQCYVGGRWQIRNNSRLAEPGVRDWRLWRMETTESRDNVLQSRTTSELHRESGRRTTAQLSTPLPRSVHTSSHPPWLYTVTNYKWTSSGVWSTNDCPTFYSTTKVCAHQQPSSLTLYHDGHKPWRLRKSYMKNRLLPKWMTLTFLVNIATHSPLNISETVRDRCLVPKVKVHRQEMALAYRDQMVTWSMTSRDCKRSNSWPQYTLRAQYLKNNRRCYLAIIAK